jgi:hypothetical protein
MNGGGTAYVETGGKEPIEIQLSNRFTGKPLLGSTTIKIRIRRHNDDLYYDWSDDTFKAFASVVQLLESLLLVNNVQSPGLYRLSTGTHIRGFDTSLVQNLLGDDALEVTILQDGANDAAGLPIGFELKVGNFLDSIMRIVGLQKENYFIDNMIYNTPGLMTSARIRLFRTKAAADAATDGGAGEGEFATYAFASSPNVTKPERADSVRSTKE